MAGDYTGVVTRRATGCAAPALTASDAVTVSDHSYDPYIEVHGCTFSYSMTGSGLGALTAVGSGCALEPAGLAFVAQTEVTPDHFDVLWSNADGSCSVEDHWALTRR